MLIDVEVVIIVVRKYGLRKLVGLTPLPLSALPAAPN